ncbi:uncharacterized protein K452DRAFT_110974 [Aplosporella prunicola CBS 121167]|uniref:Uncharacterized protein n=1 Tax=Aplosporella prunicola CBS 121167 TaxID=1176127 RepID=A0A6A6AZT4_9PEZI|nr:uncharacterized protein K452DRAFT_110974 [Aplosporella prunicola CBS 121167]KAF2137429.1 hypothetical protein K452DRAFT_110974 [Aplosporella prunicola CBS 121167]
MDKLPSLLGSQFVLGDEDRVWPLSGRIRAAGTWMPKSEELARVRPPIRTRLRVSRSPLSGLFVNLRLEGTWSLLSRTTTHHLLKHGMPTTSSRTRIPRDNSIRHSTAAQTAQINQQSMIFRSDHNALFIVYDSACGSLRVWRGVVGATGRSASRVRCGGDERHGLSVRTGLAATAAQRTRCLRCAVMTLAISLSW